MTNVMMRAGMMLALLLMGDALLAMASEPTAEAPRISVGSVMTPQPTAETVSTTTVEPPLAPTY